jgi:hypothetical protein
MVRTRIFVRNHGYRTEFRAIGRYRRLQSLLLFHNK